MRFKHFSAVKTLNGKSRWQAKKCLFSVTRTSAPTHSVYAAINASAVLKPFSSYLNAISKGTIISSSIEVKAIINLLNSRKVSEDRFLFTSSKIVRGMRMLCRCDSSNNFCRKSNALYLFNGPKANMYSLESMTNCNLLFPDFLSCFSQGFYNIFLVLLENGGRFFCNFFSYLCQMLFSLFRIFHYLSPKLVIYYKINPMSMQRYY